MKKFFNRSWAIFVLSLLTILGAVLRWGNITPYKYYPDAYQNLLVAENIRLHSSVAGTLGEGGYFFPPFVAWTRPVYPILINALNIIVQDSENAARIIAFVFGVLAIPVSFFLTKRILKSNLAGLSSALLITFSFNHTVWSGTIMTETTGVLLLLLFLLALFWQHNKPAQFADWRDYLTGLLFGLSIMTRYEYAILAIPVALFIIQSTSSPIPRIVNFAAGALMPVSIIVTWLFPFRETIAGFLHQTDYFSKVALGIVVGFLLFLFAVRFFPHGWRKKMRIPTRIIGQFISGTLLLLFLVRLTAGQSVLPFLNKYSGISSFIADDPLISILAVIGFILLFQSEQYSSLLLFSLCSLLLINFFYLRTNPTMERYLTHSIPFLLIPASLAVVKIFSIRNKIIKAVLCTLLFALCSMQLLTTFRGYKKEKSGAFYRPSYEETAAKKIAQMLINDDYLLIAGFPEPYYFFTQLPTQSISDKPPYIYAIRNVSDEQKIIVIEDLGMREVFPRFSRFLEKSLSNKIVQSFYTGERYVYITHSSEEEYPVVLYEITAGELKKETGLP